MNITPKLDSLKISHKQLVKATEALIELKYYKRQAGLTQQQLHNKDVVIQFYERGYNKYMKSDSISSILLKNKNVEINELDILYQQEKKERKLQKLQKVALSISLPVAVIAGFLAGWYLHK